MMTNKESIKIVNFITPGAGVLVLGCGHIRHIVKIHYFFKNLLYSYAIVLRDYDVAFLYQCWFSFILWWGCWYTNMSPSVKKSVWSRWYSGYRYGLWGSFSLKKVLVQNYLICIWYVPQLTPFFLGRMSTIRFPLLSSRIFMLWWQFSSLPILQLLPFISRWLFNFENVSPQLNMPALYHTHFYQWSLNSTKNNWKRFFLFF